MPPVSVAQAAAAAQADNQPGVFSQKVPNAEALEALASDTNGKEQDITFVVLGASGDLAKKKIFPVLW